MYAYDLAFNIFRGCSSEINSLLLSASAVFTVIQAIKVPVYTSYSVLLR